jgi:hypothetical protein
MKLKKLMAAFVACLALAAVSATAAQAAWEVEGVGQASGFTETVSIAKSENFTLTGKFLGSEVVLTATGLSCATGATCEITQEGTKDASSGKLTFSGVSVDKPAGCTAPETLTTESLVDELIMDPSGGTATFDKFIPKAGATAAFIEITLTGTCAIAGTPFPVKGTVTGLTENTKVSLVSQPVSFSAANQTTGGGSLLLGKEAATLAGKATNTLSGVNAGKKWGGS